MWILDQQKKTLVTGSDTESENKTHGARKGFPGVSGVTTQCQWLQVLVK